MLRSVAVEYDASMTSPTYPYDPILIMAQAGKACHTVPAGTSHCHFLEGYFPMAIHAPRMKKRRL
jgi:hypothetical protein